MTICGCETAYVSYHGNNTWLAGSIEELTEQVLKSREEEGDGEGRGGGERERPRRTWAESVATPEGHQGRKMWVASLIEALITPAVGDHQNNVSTSPPQVPTWRSTD